MQAYFINGEWASTILDLENKRDLVTMKENIWSAL